MFNDPQFWIFVSFVIFIISVFKPIRTMLISGLDNKINEIKENIDQAEKIKNEAQQALSEINKRQNDLKQEIKVIQNDAKEKINFVEQHFNQRLNEQIIKRNELAKVKIEQMTRDANMQVQQYIVQNVIKSTFKLLEKKLDQSEKQKLITESIEELNSVLKH